MLTGRNIRTTLCLAISLAETFDQKTLTRCLPDPGSPVQEHWSGIASDWSGIASDWSGIASDWSGIPSDWSGIASDWSGIPSHWSGIASESHFNVK